jgi:outer membrane protein
MKTVLMVLMGALLSISHAVAQESGWMLRARTAQMKMEDNGTSGLGWTAANKSLAALDVSYFLNKNVAVELFWPASQTLAVSAAGVNKGTFVASPHALVLQYHVTDWARVQPYLGMGMNNTQYSSANLTGNQTTDRSSWGAALQMGANFPVDKNWSVNVDMKKLYSQTDIESAGVHQGTLKLNPTLMGVGVGYRF